MKNKTNISVSLPIEKETHDFIKCHEKTIQNMEKDLDVKIGSQTNTDEWDGRNGKITHELVVEFPNTMEELENKAHAVLREIEHSKESFNTPQPCCQSNHEEDEEIDGETKEDIEFIRRNFKDVSGEIDDFVIAECVYFKDGLPVGECRIGGHAMALLVKTFLSVYGTEE